MKKPFQILNTAIIIMVFSCGIQNACRTANNEVSEVSMTNPSLANEPAPLFSDPAVQGLFKLDLRDRTPNFQYRPSARTAYYTIDRSDLAKTMVKLSGPSGVN